MNYSEYFDAFNVQVKSFGVNISDSEVALVFPYFRKKVFKKGQVFLKAGDFTNEAYFIIKGLIRSYNILPNGTEKTYIICREHNIFTEHCSFITQKPSTDYLEALEDTEVLCIAYNDLMALYQNHHIWESLGRKMGELNFMVSLSRLQSLMNDSAEKRYKRYLKSFQNIVERIPQNVAASYLGITPQSFSRLKREISDSHI